MNNPELYRFAQLIIKAKSTNNISSTIAPKEAELCDLLDGKLPFIRKQEIYQYLNNDKQLFDAWIALIEAKEAVSEDQAKPESQLSKIHFHLLNFFALKWVLSTSIAASIAVILAIYQVTHVAYEPPQDQLRFGKTNQEDLTAASGKLMMLKYVTSTSELCIQGSIKQEHIANYKSQIVRSLEDMLLNQEPLPTILENLSELSKIDSITSLCSFNKRLKEQLT